MISNKPVDGVEQTPSSQSAGGTQVLLELHFNMQVDEEQLSSASQLSTELSHLGIQYPLTHCWEVSGQWKVSSQPTKAIQSQNWILCFRANYIQNEVPLISGWQNPPPYRTNPAGQTQSPVSRSHSDCRMRSEQLLASSACLCMYPAGCTVFGGHLTS